MRYDFDSVVDRSGTAAVKWDIRSPEEAKLGYLPLSVADMEFKSPPCVKTGTGSTARTAP